MTDAGRRAELGGSLWARRLAARRPRSSTIALVRLAVERSSHASVLAEVRPATTTSARRSAKTAARRARASLNASADPRVGAAAQPSTGSVGRGKDDICWRVEVDAEPPAIPEVVDAEPGDLAEPSRKRIVGLDVRQVVEDPCLSDGDRIRRVPIVCQRRRSAGRGDGDERPPVCSGRQRQRARTEDDDASRSDVPHEGPQPVPERGIVGRAADQPDVLGPDGSEARDVPRGEREPRIRERRGSADRRPAAGPGGGRGR